jgi:hypothetical protein
MAHIEPAEELAPTQRRQVSALRRRVRVLRRRLDNIEVRRARIMMARLRESPVDVLAIGDSVWAFTASYDEDQRKLAQMIDDDLGPEISMHSVVGAGYNANLIDAYLGLAQRGGFRPKVVVVPLTWRLVTVAWGEHPNYTYREAVKAINRMPGDIPLWRIRKAVRPASAADFEAYDKLEITAFGETAPIGDFRRRLKQPERFGLDRAGREKLAYTFHHGEQVGPDAPRLEAVRQLGRRIASMGSRVVTYETGIMLDRGEELHGSVFRTQTLENHKCVGDAFQEGLGDSVEILQTGAMFSNEEFIDPEDGVEHYNAVGRLHLNELIVDAVKRAL